MEYEIIDKASVPPMVLEGYIAKWRPLFDPLPFNKAIKFIVSDQQRGQKLGISIQSALRAKRGIEYKVVTRCIPNGDTAILFVWKVKRESNG